MISLIFYIFAQLLYEAARLALVLSLLFLALIGYRIARVYLGPRRKIEGQDAVLITGATSGIGLALSKRLFGKGYSVVACYYDSNEPGYKQLHDLQAKHHGQNQIYLIKMNVRDVDSVREAASQCKKELSRDARRLYAIVNNAGVGSLQLFALLQRQTIRSLVETNLLGTMYVTREFLSQLAKSGHESRVLNVSSGLACIPGATYATYGATKLAQIYLTKSLNKELRERYKVTSVAIVPHNFIKNTNISTQNLKSNEQSWSELNELERKIFGKEFNEQVERSKQLEVASKEHAKRKAQRPPTGALARLAAMRLGESRASSIEDSGALDAFERALDLVSPPDTLFAGDFGFSMVFGSMLLASPLSLSSLLSDSVVEGLYR